MGPNTGVDYYLTLCPLQSRLQHIYHGQPYARVDLNPIPERLYPTVRDFGFCLGCALSEVVCNIYSPSKLPPQISLLLIQFYTKFPN
jgi:hypothetical protein